MIEVHDLHRSFSTREAVMGISFCVPCGEIFDLLGPKGAGKSTTNGCPGQFERRERCALLIGAILLLHRQTTVTASI